MSSQTILKASNIEFHYANQIGIEQVSLEVKQGEVLALLGPNGSGKSSLLKLLSGRRFPSHGSIKLLGQHLNPKQVHYSMP